MPERIQRQRTKGWRMPEGAIYVGRPTKWGNPFRVGAVVNRIALANRNNHSCVVVRAEDAADAVRHYRHWLNGTALLVDGRELAPQPPSRAEVRAALAGRDLCCWCPLGSACHADVLLEVANG